jgi:hypothetical protein
MCEQCVVVFVLFLLFLLSRFDTDIGLDCSPSAPPTHWKQTVVSLPVYVEVRRKKRKET